MQVQSITFDYDACEFSIILGDDGGTEFRVSLEQIMPYVLVRAGIMPALMKDALKDWWRSKKDGDELTVE